MEISHEHLVNYDVYFSFDNAFNENKRQEFITSFSFGKLTDKKPVFTSGRKQFAAIESNTSLIAGRIVTFALEEDNGTPLPYLLDFVNKSIFAGSSAMYYQSVDEIEIPVNIFFYNKVTGKTFSFNDMVFTNVSSEKDVTSGKVLYVIDYFCSTLTPSPKSSLIDEKTNTEETGTEKVEKETAVTTEEKNENKVDVSSVGALLLNDVGNDKDNYHLFETEMSPGGVKLSFNIPNILLSLNSSFHSFEISSTISENNKSKKLTFVFPTLVLPHEKIDELKPESFVGEENIIKFAEREDIKKYRISYIESKLKEISRYIDSDKVDLVVVVGDEDKFYFNDYPLHLAIIAAGHGLVIVPVLNFGPTHVYNFFSEISFTKRDVFSREYFGSLVYFVYYNVNIDNKDFFVSEQAIQFGSRIKDQNLFILQKIKAGSQEILFNNLPNSKITFNAGDFLSEYSLVKDTYVFLDKTKNELKDIVKLGLLPNISSNLTGVAESYDEKTELSVGSKLYIKPDLNSFALEVVIPPTSYYQLAKNESFAVVQFLCFAFFTPSSNTYFEGEKVFYKGVECSLVLKTFKPNSSYIATDITGKLSFDLPYSIIVLDKVFKSEGLEQKDCYVYISNDGEAYYFLKDDLLDYTPGKVTTVTYSNHVVTYSTSKVNVDNDKVKTNNGAISEGFVKDVFDKHLSKRFLYYSQKCRPLKYSNVSDKQIIDCSALVWAYFVLVYGFDELGGYYPDTFDFRNRFLSKEPIAIFHPKNGNLVEKEINSFAFREEDIIVFVSNKSDSKNSEKFEKHIGLVSIVNGEKYFCDTSSSTNNYESSSKSSSKSTVGCRKLYNRLNGVAKSYGGHVISCYVYRGIKKPDVK